MDKENNISETKYQYCICNVLFKGFDKDKVYILHESIDHISGIEFHDRYIMNNGEKTCVNELKNKDLTILHGCKIKLIQPNTSNRNIFGRYKFTRVKLPSLLGMRLPEEVIYNYYSNFYSKLYIMNRDNKEFLYPYSYVISNLVDRVNALVGMKDDFKTNEEYEKYVQSSTKILEECSSVVCNLFGVFKMSEKNNRKIGIECLNDFLEDSKKSCKICNDFIDEMKSVYIDKGEVEGIKKTIKEECDKHSHCNDCDFTDICYS